MQIRLQLFCAKLVTDKQTNNDENITSLAESFEIAPITLATLVSCEREL